MDRDLSPSSIASQNDLIARGIMKKFALAVLCVTLLSGAIACQRSTPNTETTSPSSEGLPGEGIIVHAVHTVAPDDHFATAVVNKSLEKLGYEIEESEEITLPILYTVKTYK